MNTKLIAKESVCIDKSVMLECLINEDSYLDLRQEFKIQIFDCSYEFITEKFRKLITKFLDTKLDNCIKDPNAVSEIRNKIKEFIKDEDFVCNLFYNDYISIDENPNKLRASLEESDYNDDIYENCICIEAPLILDMREFIENLDEIINLPTD